MQEKIKKSALGGIRVIDMTRVLAGPYCTLLLGDMGAEIIKIEVPGHGDDSRKYPPFIGTESAYFMNLNRNKKSLTLNLKTLKGKDVFLDLVKRSDVLIENFRPGTLDDLGVGYAKLKTINPNLDLFLNIRFRSIRTLQGPPRLRHHRPGYGWHYERDRLAGDSALQNRNRDCRYSCGALRLYWNFE